MAAGSGGSTRRRGGVAPFIAGGLVALIVLIGVLVGALTGFDKTGAGEVAVVRNGGWFDNKRIRQVIGPGSGLTWIGFWSTMHRYPSQQRFYTLTADPARAGQPGINVAHTPSSDGVDMGIEATIYFTLNTDEAAIKSFDDKFGTRDFLGADGERRYPWDGMDGWNSFFDAVVRPIIDNDLRVQINNFRCAELVSSCALVQNSSVGGTPAPAPATATGQANNTNIAKVQQAINDSLQVDLRDTLGGDFFQNIKFNLVRVSLPGNVQDAVNKAQAAFAQVSEAQAKVAQAQAEADANKKRQEGYNACTTCAQIDMIKALPPGLTTYAPGAGTTVPIK
jgi:regulator of protease activity HflC (stomatin/prohibitin superfamily)